MRHLHHEAVSPVPRDKLFPWYVDFSEEDVNLNAKYGDGTLKERKVRRISDRHLLVDSRLESKGRAVRLHYDVTINPEEFTYDTTIVAEGAYEVKRHYAFLETPDGGTRIVFDDNYKLYKNLYKFLDLFGQARKMLMRSSVEVMHTYLKAAEKELSSK